MSDSLVLSREELTKRLKEAEEEIKTLKGEGKTEELVGPTFCDYLLETEGIVLCSVSDINENVVDLRNIAFVTSRLEDSPYKYETYDDPYRFATPLNTDGTRRVYENQDTVSLTGTSLAEYLINTNQAPFFSFVSDTSDSVAIMNGARNTVVGYSHSSIREFLTCGCSWNYAVPVDSFGKPLTLEVPVAVVTKRTISGMELLSYLLDKNMYEDSIRCAVSDISEERCKRPSRTFCPQSVLSMNTEDTLPIRTTNSEWNYAVPLNEDNSIRYLEI